MTSNLKLQAAIATLAIAVVLSAVAGVVTKHKTRKLFMELQTLNAERDLLEMEWGRLQIEQGTWSTHARVDQLAREQMNMHEPLAEKTRLVSTGPAK